MDIEGPDEDLSGVVIEDEAALDLEISLNKSRMLKRRKQPIAPEDELQRRGVLIKEEAESVCKRGDSIVLNSTSEFCRALGEIPTYGMAGNREDEEEEMMDFDQEDNVVQGEAVLSATGWQTVDIDTRPVDIDDQEGAGLDDEPTIDGGLASTLLLAKKKGNYREPENYILIQIIIHILHNMPRTLKYRFIFEI